MPSLTNQAIQATKWNFLRTIINPVKSFVVSVFLARLLLPEDFGVIAMAMIFASIADGLVDFGMGEALIQKKEVSSIQKNTLFYLNLLMGFILSSTMFFLSTPLSSFFNMEVLKPVTQVLSLTFIFRAFNCIQSAQIKKKLNFKVFFISEFAGGLISGVIGIVMAFNGFGVWSLVISQLSGNVISTIWIWYSSSWRPQLEFKLSSIKELWSFGYKLSLTRLIEVVFNRIDTFVIGKIFSASTLGFYNRAQSLNRLVIQYSFSAFSGVLFPLFSKMQNDLARFRTNTLRVLQIVSFSTFFFTGLMYICSTELITLIYGEKWLASIPLFKILGLFSFCFTLPTILNTPIKSLGKSSLLLRLEIVKRILTVSVIPIGIYWGLYNYVLAINIAISIGLLLNIFVLKNIIQLPLKKQFSAILTYALPCACLIVISILCESFFLNSNYIIALIIKGTLFTTIYIAYSYYHKTDGFLFIWNYFGDKIKSHK